MTRRERLERKLEKRGQWAGKAKQRSSEAFATAGSMAEAIPFGQPILVGHHSERRDRNYRARIHGKMDRGLAEHRKAEHHESKAHGLAIALERSIFDDDPDALERLQEKIDGLEAACKRALGANAAWRRGGREAVAAEFGENLATAAAEAMRPGYSWIKSPFGNTHNRAEIRRCKLRIVAIKKQRERAEQAENSGGLSLVEGNGWAVVTFAEKPDRATLSELREAGFRWGKGSWHGYSSKLPDRVRELIKAAAGECLCSEVDAYECVPCERARHESEAEPRRSPRPCSEGCPGWGVFNVGLAEEGIERCDDCWHGLADAAEDSDYGEHPVCQAALESERKKAGIAVAPEECEDNDCTGCAWCDEQGITQEQQAS